MTCAIKLRYSLWYKQICISALITSTSKNLYLHSYITPIAFVSTYLLHLHIQIIQLHIYLTIYIQTFTLTQLFTTCITIYIYTTIREISISIELFIHIIISIFIFTCTRLLLHLTIYMCTCIFKSAHLDVYFHTYKYSPEKVLLLILPQILVYMHHFGTNRLKITSTN